MDPSDKERAPASGHARRQQNGQRCQVDAPRQSLFHVPGIEDSSPIPAVANTPTNDFQSIFRECKSRGQAPSPALERQAGLFGRARRCFCGHRDEAAAATEARDDTPHLTRAPQPSAARKVKASTIADEACDDEHDIMSPESLQNAYDTRASWAIGRAQTHNSY